MKLENPNAKNINVKIENCYMYQNFNVYMYCLGDKEVTGTSTDIWFNNAIEDKRNMKKYSHYEFPQDGYYLICFNYPLVNVTRNEIGITLSLPYEECKIFKYNFKPCNINYFTIIKAKAKQRLEITKTNPIFVNSLIYDGNSNNIKIVKLL